MFWPWPDHYVHAQPTNSSSHGPNLFPWGIAALPSAVWRYRRRGRCCRLQPVFDIRHTLLWIVLCHQQHTPYLAPTPSFLFRSNRQYVCPHYLPPCDGQLINHNCAVLFKKKKNLPPHCPMCRLLSQRSEVAPETPSGSVSRSINRFKKKLCSEFNI